MTPVNVQELGITNYAEVYRQMQAFTAQRTAETTDEIWCTEHQPVFTQGQAGKSEHVLAPGDIPVIATDRGGQVTYHGPGQLVVYLMLDLRRVGIKVRGLVTGIEQAIISTLAGYNIAAAARPDAPGVYCNGDKIASLGLRVRKGYSYHGLSLNVAMDLEPFERINPCGLQGMNVVQVSELGGPNSIAEVQQGLLAALLAEYGLKPCSSDS